MNLYDASGLGVSDSEVTGHNEPYCIPTHYCCIQNRYTCHVQSGYSQSEDKSKTLAALMLHKTAHTRSQIIREIL